MSTVLVTGGSGFIGSHAISQLLAAGHEVRTTVRDGAREPALRAEVRARAGGPLIELSVREGELVKQGQLLGRIDAPVLGFEAQRGSADRDAATRPAATHCRDRFFQVRLMNPKLLTGLGIDCKHIIRAGGNINHTLCNDGLRLTGERRPHA